MATNFVQEGDILELAAPRAITSGEVGKIGSILGVALQDLASGESGLFATEGVWTLAKTTGTAWTVGLKLYWDNTNFLVTTTSNTGANAEIGVATAAATSGATTGTVLLGLHG